MSEDKLRLILVTTTRADWGILTPLARALTLHPGVSLTIAAGNMHLSQKYGHTVDEIRDAGFDSVEILDCPEADGTLTSRIAIAAATATSLGRLIERTAPDGIILLGDRYEILGAATAAVIAGVPIVHLHGGEVTEGALDDAVRNAVSKMASLHLAATRQAARRLEAMGEEPRRIVHTGALGVANALAVEPLPIEELEKSLDGFKIDPDSTLLVTYHPVTRHPRGLTTEKQTDSLLTALGNIPNCNILITAPNNDPGSEVIVDALKQFADNNSDRVKFVKSLGRLRYLSALHHVKAVVGNTSSGLLEAPSTPAYTIDIGPRQQGRERAADVIHVEDDAPAIEAAIRRVLAMPHRKVMPEDNPYYRPDTVATAVKAITDLLPALPKSKKVTDAKI